MKKFIVGLVIVVVVVVVWFVAMRDDSKPEVTTSLAPSPSATASLTVGTGSYQAYSAEKTSLATTGDVVLFFRAAWCPECRALDADIKANLQNIPAGLTILDVDYDNSSDLKKKYGVTYQHTMVQVDAQGNLIKKWQGSPTLAKLVAEVQ